MSSEEQAVPVAETDAVTAATTVEAVAIPSTIVEASEANIARAVDALRAGEVVAFPTETVYGLGADAHNAEALRKIFKLKGRPADHPLILHMASAASMEQFAQEIPQAAHLLAERFWPGPLTLILKRAAGVSDAVTGGQDTVGLRVPAHPVAQQLLQAFGGALAAPSANKFGRVSPTQAAHVAQDFGPQAPMILDGDAAPVGIESTIVDVSGARPRMLRPGAIGAAAIEEVLGEPLAPPDENSPRVSGALEKHYAPRAALRVVKRVEMIDLLVGNRGRRVAVLAVEVKVPRLSPTLVRVLPAIATQYAQSLYASLRELDATGADLILVEQPPQTPSWTAVNDRLQRAQSPAKKS
ncbi:MAG TPA: L-threonylcarbamoyladenylate synthase [Burkholderiales bacterium]|nr:L-threonylcarbamoyladenylate synthase [Burkholderiales bacterium]